MFDTLSMSWTWSWRSYY